MRPLAVPACCGAMSMGIDQIGPITSSRKKKPPLSNMAIVTIIFRPKHHAKKAARSSEHSDQDDTQARKLQISGPMENAIAYHATKRIANHAARENAESEQCRILKVEVIAIFEEGRQPVQQKPQCPAIAEIGQRHRQNTKGKPFPGDFLFDFCCAVGGQFSSSSWVMSLCSLGLSRKYKTQAATQMKLMQPSTMKDPASSNRQSARPR